MHKSSIMQWIGLVFVSVVISFFAYTAKAHCGGHGSQPYHGLPDIPYVGCINPSVSGAFDQNIDINGKFSVSCDINGNCLLLTTDDMYVIHRANWGHFYLYQDGVLITLSERPYGTSLEYFVLPQSFTGLSLGNYTIDVVSCVFNPIICDTDSFSWTALEPPIPACAPPLCISPVPQPFTVAPPITDCKPSVTLSWTVSVNANHYSIEAAVDANKNGMYDDGLPYTVIAKTTFKKITDINVKRGTRYFYFVRAHNKESGTDGTPIPVYAQVPVCPPSVKEIPPQ